MTTTPMSVKNRPFSVEPISGIMLPDGIFDTAIFEQQITVFYTNNGTSDLEQVTIYFEGISDNNIVVSPKTHFFPVIPAGASVKISWLGNFQNASCGKKNVSIIAKADGFELKREIKQIFVSRTTFDQNSNTYTCEIPEGSMKVKLLSVITEKDTYNCKVDRKSPPLWIPVKLELDVTPNPSYEGQFGDLPFQDPWWKIVAWIVAAVAAIGAAIAAAFGEGKASIGVSGTFDESNGEIGCCKPNDGLTLEERLTVAGALSTVASGAIVVGCADDKDPWRRGQEATQVKTGEITVRENLKLNMGYSEPPQSGKPYSVEVDWTYSRITDKNIYTHHIRETRTNIHVLQDLIVNAPNKLKIFRDPFVFTAKFIKENGKPFVGNELFVYALVVSPTNVAYRVPMVDDGIEYDKKANDGIFTGYLDWEVVLMRYRKQKDFNENLLWGYWRIYIYAQDVNLASPSMEPLEAATYIGGMMVASATEITFDSTLPCPLTANATIEVVP